jgi:hypothetical protein
MCERGATQTKVQALLVYLAVEADRPHRRRALVELIFDLPVAQFMDLTLAEAPQQEYAATEYS